jgi:hypothetical protein
LVIILAMRIAYIDLPKAGIYIHSTQDHKGTCSAVAGQGSSYDK